MAPVFRFWELFVLPLMLISEAVSMSVFSRSGMAVYLVNGEEKMAFVIIFWTTYIPFVILVLSLVGRYAMRAAASLPFERLLRGESGASPKPSVNRQASAYATCRSP
jgi:hypothetical protein